MASNYRVKPNVLLITTDHWRYDCLGANGNDYIRTPVLDELAREGASLDRCYVQSPYCMPSRASIWTGRYPQNHRVTTNGIALSKREKTLAHALAEAGYFTGNIGKLHFIPHFGRDHTQNEALYEGYGYQWNRLSDEPGCYPDAYVRWVERVAPEHLNQLRVPGPQEARGHFDEWTLAAPEQYSHPAWIVSETERFLDERKRGAPFFLSVGFYGPHPPLNPPREFVERYDVDSLPLPAWHAEEAGDSRLRDVTPEQWRRMKAFFYAMCSHIDAKIGAILDIVRQHGLKDDTLVVFTADHGDVLGDHGQIGKDPTNYESIIRVPCILRLPHRLPAGRRVAGMVESIDLMPTICELAGVEAPPGVKGRPCADLLRGEREDGRPDVLVEFRDPRTGRAIKTLRSSEHKYYIDESGHEILYDLNEADEEVFNRAADPTYRELLHDFRHRMLQRLVNAESDLPQRTHEY